MTIDQRRFVHGLWASVADRWREHADYVELRCADVNRALLDGAALSKSDRVLELACGPGGLGLAASQRVREVVCSDVVPAMVEIAQERAHAAGAANVTTKVLDIEDIAEPDDSFDAIVVREGLMFAVDPSAALREMKRVLRRGGRLASAVWAEPASNPWLAIVMESVAVQVGHPVPPPGMPGPFALADAERLGNLARDAGFANVNVERVAVPLHAPSVDEWWARTVGVAGPVATIVQNLPAPAAAELYERVATSAQPYLSADGLDLPGESLVLTASA